MSKVLYALAWVVHVFVPRPSLVHHGRELRFLLWAALALGVIRALAVYRFFARPWRALELGMLDGLRLLLVINLGLILLWAFGTIGSALTRKPKPMFWQIWSGFAFVLDRTRPDGWAHDKPSRVAYVLVLLIAAATLWLIGQIGINIR